MPTKNRDEVYSQFENLDIPECTKDLIKAIGKVDGLEDISFALEVSLCQHHLRELLSFLIMPKSDHADCDEHEPVKETH